MNATTTTRDDNASTSSACSQNTGRLLMRLFSRWHRSKMASDNSRDDDDATTSVSSRSIGQQDDLLRLEDSFRRYCSSIRNGAYLDSQGEDSDEGETSRQGSYWKGESRSACFLYGSFPVSKYPSDHNGDVVSALVKFLALDNDSDDDSEADLYENAPSYVLQEFHVWLPTFLIESLYGHILHDPKSMLRLRLSSQDALYLATLFYGMDALTIPARSCSTVAFIAAGPRQCRSDARVVEPRNGGARLTKWIKRFVMENDNDGFDQTLENFRRLSQRNNNGGSRSRKDVGSTQRSCVIS